MRLTIEDPFGLARADARAGRPQALLVYPRLVDARPALLGGRRARAGRPPAAAAAADRLRPAQRARVQRGRVAAQGALALDRAARAADGEGARGRAARRGRGPARRRRARRQPARASTSRCAPPARSCRRTSPRGAAARSSSTRPRARCSRSTSESDWRRALELLAGAEPDARDARVRAAPGGRRRRRRARSSSSSSRRASTRRSSTASSQRALSRRGVVARLRRGASPGREPQLLRLQAVGVPVAVVRRGDDLAAALGAPGGARCVGRSLVSLAPGGRDRGGVAAARGPASTVRIARSASSRSRCCRRSSARCARARLRLLVVALGSPRGSPSTSRRSIRRHVAGAGRRAFSATASSTSTTCGCRSTRACTRRCAASSSPRSSASSLALAFAVAARRPLAASLVAARRRGLAGDACAAARARSSSASLILLGVARRARGADHEARAPRRRCPRRRCSCSSAIDRLDLGGGGEGRPRLVAALGLLHRAAAAGRASRSSGTRSTTASRFPRKRTTVLEVKAPRRSLYWRAAVLDEFDARPLGEERRRCARDVLVPDARGTAAACVRTCRCSRSRTRISSARACRCRYDAGDAPLVSHVARDRVAAVRADARLPLHGVELRAASRRGAARRARSRVYPVELDERGTFLDVWHRRRRAAVRRAATRGRAAAALLDATPDAARYAPLCAGDRGRRRRAHAVRGRGRARVVVPLRRRLRVHEPSRVDRRGAPLVDFVAQTRAGLLPALRRRDGADAALPRRARARRGRLLERDVRRAASGVWRVTDHDAHAWVEVWFRGYGWLPFDPTPSRARPSAGQLSAPYAAAILAGCPRAGRPRDPRRSTSATRARAAHHHGEEGAGVRGLGRGRRGPPPVSSHGGSLLVLLALVAAAIAAGIVVTKLARAARALPDARPAAARGRLPAGARRLSCSTSGSTRRGARRCTSSARSFATSSPSTRTRSSARATAARFGPPAGRGAGRPARAARAACAAARRARAPAGARPRARAPVASLARLRAVRHAVVMAAGEGSRLRPLTERWPKPVLPIDGRPVIATLLRELAGAGLRARDRRHRPPRRAGRGAARRRLGVRRSRCASCASPASLGSADAVQRARRRGRGPPFLVTRGRHASTRRATSAASPRRSTVERRRRDRGAPRARRPPAGARQRTGSSRAARRRPRRIRSRRRRSGRSAPTLVPLLDGLSGPAVRARRRGSARGRRRARDRRGRDRADAGLDGSG